MTEHPRFFQAPKGHFFLFGPRGTGKSTWLRQNLKGDLTIDLLDPPQERELQARPEVLRERVEGMARPGTIVIDEVQRAPGVLAVVHALIEEKKPGRRFVLTGSSARKLRRTGVDLLGGRAARKSMHPFLASELGDAFDLDQALGLGMVPGVLGDADPSQALRAYLALYVREEVKAEGLVRSLEAFGRFLEAISFSHAQPVNLANIARDCQQSRTTVGGYLEVLDDLLLAFRLPVFQRRAQRQLTSHPKFYWFDAGVYRSIRPAGQLDRPEEIAIAALEGLVAQHLRAWIDYGGLDLQLYFWRTKSGTEVDFVVYGKKGFWAIEVKNSGRVHEADLRGLAAFAEDYPQAQRLLLYRGKERRRVQGVLCMPCAEFLASLVPGKELPG
ncbi:MAG: ATP-binding protein [Planctomycetes bacterium]|nr:ATP-binding protein [Planctomycetota bacterium]